MTTNLNPRPGRALQLTELPWSNWVLLLATGVISLRPLTPTWNDNPNYSFGWLIPLVCLFFFIERWSARPLRQAAESIRFTIPLILWGVLFFAFRPAVETDPDWRPGLWVLVGLYVAALLGWLWTYGGVAWLRHFAFPVCFLFLSLPWFFEVEHPLVQGLMRWNAVLVASSLQLIGISAVPEGNLIQLQNCQLGVEEACSGILSLQASLMMGCLLGEIYRLLPWNRIGLVVASMGLALLGNYLRTLFLALMAFYSGPGAVTQWHDTAGYSILVFTGVGSWLTALCLGRVKEPGVLAVDEQNLKSGALELADHPVRGLNAQRFTIVIFSMALFAEVCTQAWFVWRESALVRHPEWTVRWPASESLQEPALSDITRTALRCDSAKIAQWKDGQGWKWTSYWLRYDPKPYTRVVLGWHTPDNCLPTVGLTKDRDYPAFTTSVNGIEFYIEPKKFLSKESTIYLFWVVYPDSGGRPADTDTRISAPFATKFRTHLQDMWNGYRGVGVETLETAIDGPPDYDAAKAGYLSLLRAAVVPGRGTEPDLMTGTSH